MKIIVALLGITLILGANIAYIVSKKSKILPDEIFGSMCALVCLFGFILLLYAK